MTLAAPVVDVVIIELVAFEILSTISVSKSDIPENASFILLPRDLIILLLPVVMEEIVAPKTFPIPEIRSPSPSSLYEFRLSRMSLFSAKISSRVMRSGGLTS